MPNYEYRCPGCGHILILDRKIDDRDKPALCGHGRLGAEAVEMKRSIGCSGFLLKGGGWYRDGYSGKPA